MTHQINDNTDEFLHCCVDAQRTINAFLDQSKDAVLSISATAEHSDTQFIRHGFAWQASLAQAFDAITQWMQTLHSQQEARVLELTVAKAATTDIVGQLLHGIDMSQLETFRPDHIAVNTDDLKRLASAFCSDTHTQRSKIIVDELLKGHTQTRTGIDSSLQLVANQFYKFADTHITPFAQQWHLDNALIPEALVNQLGELGVFGLTIDEQYGGSGYGKLAMCVVTEELSRGYIGVGSLGTRSEIAAELIQKAGSTAQQQKYLPGIASGSILPTAVFTEPDTGSDLGSIDCRATRTNDGHWQIIGNKTWITHAARSDLMTLLARTDAGTTNHSGLSMLLIDKQRGSEANPFPDNRISGSEIEVLGYRGMREYDLAFDRFTAPQSALLGDMQGQGFKQLMTTFESARIQTAARAVGVARNAFELATTYAQERHQFGHPLITFERIYGKLARMLTDTEIARQMTFAAARSKDMGQRCDVAAGMAKLLAARTAWSCADCALQIHGGMGYAMEHPVSRLLNDARILSVFEGTSEIQSEVIARRLLES